MKVIGFYFPSSIPYQIIGMDDLLLSLISPLLVKTE